MPTRTLRFNQIPFERAVEMAEENGWDHVVRPDGAVVVKEPDTCHAGPLFGVGTDMAMLVIDPARETVTAVDRLGRIGCSNGPALRTVRGERWMFGGEEVDHTLSGIVRLRHNRHERENLRIGAVLVGEQLHVRHVLVDDVADPDGSYPVFWRDRGTFTAASVTREDAEMIRRGEALGGSGVLASGSVVGCESIGFARDAVRVQARNRTSPSSRDRLTAPPVRRFADLHDNPVAAQLVRRPLPDAGIDGTKPPPRRPQRLAVEDAPPAEARIICRTDGLSMDKAIVLIDVAKLGLAPAGRTPSADIETPLPMMLPQDAALGAAGGLRPATPAAADTLRELVTEGYHVVPVLVPASLAADIAQAVGSGLPLAEARVVLPGALGDHLVRPEDRGAVTWAQMTGARQPESNNWPPAWWAQQGQLIGDNIYRFCDGVTLTADPKGVAARGGSAAARGRRVAEAAEALGWGGVHLGGCPRGAALAAARLVKADPARPVTGACLDAEMVAWIRTEVAAHASETGMRLVDDALKRLGDRRDLAVNASVRIGISSLEAAKTALAQNDPRALAAVRRGLDGLVSYGSVLVKEAAPEAEAAFSRRA